MPMVSTTEVMEKKFSSEEVARMLKVSKMTVYRLIQGGELMAYRVGRSYSIPMSGLREYLGNSMVIDEES